MPIRRETRKKSAKFKFGHFCRMALVMEEYVSFDPMDICFLGAVAVMPCANRLRDLVEQARFLSCYKRLDASFEIQSAVDYSKRTIRRLVRVDVIHNILLVVRLS